MNKQEMLAVFDGFSEKLTLVLAESEGLKHQVQELVEENVRLRLENHHLQDLLRRLQSPEPERQLTRSTKHLEATYNEGFHICNDFYGQARGTSEECIICMGLLYKD